MQGGAAKTGTLLKPIDGEESVFRAGDLYREWGIWLTNIRYVAAIDAFQKAIKFGKVNDLRTLLGLCKAQAEYTRFLDAEETSAKCMQIDPKKQNARSMRIEALFKVGEFGHSLICAYDGLKHRRMPFEWNVYQNNETFHDCIGRNTPPELLRLLYPWISALDKHRKKLIAKLDEMEDEFQGIVEEDQSKFKENDHSVRREMYLEKLHSIMGMTYLGHLAVDKEFLNKLVKRPELLSSPNKTSNDQFYSYALRCLQRSIYRQDILRKRKPFYVDYFKRNQLPIGRRLYLQKKQQLEMCNIVIEAEFLLRTLHTARMRRDYLTFFNYLERARNKFDGLSKKIFSLKEKCLDALNTITAWVYTDPRNLMCLNNDNLKEIYLKHHLGVHVANLPRDSDLAWIRTNNRKEALRVFRRRFAMTSKPLQLAWLYHDFCKFFIEAGRYSLARFYVKRALDMAAKAKSDLWTLNAYHLTIRIEVNQHNRNEAKEAALMALSTAKKLGIVYLVDFYKRSFEIIEDLNFERISRLHGIAARQRIILDLMPLSMKADVDYLFRTMETIPVKRRLPIMPGFKPISQKLPILCKRNTLLPAPPKDSQQKNISLMRLYAPPRNAVDLVNLQGYE